MAAQTELSILVRIKDEATQAMGKISGALSSAEGASKGFALGLAGAVTAAVGFGVVTVRAAQDAAKTQKELEQVIKSTGGAAGVTAQEVTNMAESLAKVTNFEDDAIKHGQSLLLTFTGIGKDVFPRATEAMLDMSQIMGQDLKSSAIQLGKALNSPKEGVNALRRVGVSFTEDQVKVIEKLQDTGKMAEAQKVILDELAKEFGGQAKAQADAFTQLKNTLGEAAETIGVELLPVAMQFANWAKGLVENQLPVWIEKTKEIITWLKEHKEVVYIVGGAIIGALVPAIYAWISSMIAAAIALGPFMLAGAIIVGLVLGIRWIIKHWDELTQKAIDVWNAISDSIKIAVAVIAGPLGWMIGAAVWIANNWEMLKAVTIESWNAIAKFFKEIWEDIKKTFGSAVDWITEKVRPLLDLINRVQSSVSNLRSQYGGGGASLNPFSSSFQLPKFASGGIVTGPTLGLIGEVGPEAVIPLSRLAGLGGGVVINITGNYINDNLDIRRLADRVGEAVVNKLNLNQRVNI